MQRMSTNRSPRLDRPPPVVVAAGICAVLALISAGGALWAAAAVWRALRAGDRTGDLAWTVWTAGPGALAAAAIALVLGTTVGTLLRGDPTADGRATVAAVLAVASALGYGLAVAPWFGLVVAVAGAAVAVLVNSPRVGEWLRRCG